MAESNDVQALEKISTEVVDSQIKIILSSQCIKAQAFLYDKLRKQCDRQNEICKFISSSNLKLLTEIQLAEQEIKSHNIAIETIKFGNVELKKEYLLSKERKADILERTQIGIKKYENLWATSKIRYESILCIQNLVQVKNKNQTGQAIINSLKNESEHLIKQIKMKKNDLTAKDKARVIELAEFFVHKRPKIIKKVNDLNVNIGKLSQEVEMLVKGEKQSINDSKPFKKLCLSKHDHLQAVKEIEDSPVEDNWGNLSKNINKDTIALPRLHIQNNDLDIISIKLDQIKKVDLQNVTSLKRTGSSDLERNSVKRYRNVQNIDDCYISSYFNIAIDVNSDNDNNKIGYKQCSDKKLIHILEDVKLSKNDTYQIIHKLEPNKFQETCYITAKVINQSDTLIKSQTKANKSIEIEEIEEIDLTTKAHDDDTVAPPSKFVDVTQNVQEKKTVSFNVPNEEENQTSLKESFLKTEETELNESQEKTLNISRTSEDSYTTIKNMMLKEHNLDLSPQFVYGKNTLMQLQSDDNIITSKFFGNKENLTSEVKGHDHVDNDIKHKDQIIENENKHNENIYQHDNVFEKMDDNNVAVSSPKILQEINNLNMPVAGVLFNHGSQCIPDSLNISISTTGFEDDFPHCIDSSILLSPKADLPTTAAVSDNNEVLSQEVPNFLAGFRKTGLSFFGLSHMPDSKPGSSAQNQNSGFNFTFGNEEKKGRSGFFSMFR